MMTISQPLPAPLIKYEANNMHPIHRRLPFVHKLYHVVNSGNHIAWTQDGLSFYIPDINLFEQEVIKKSFNNSCMLSFVRQLLIYGFKRTFDGRRTRYRKPTNYASFTHPNFQRDHPNLLNLVKRQKREKKPIEMPLTSLPHITQAPPTLNLHPSSIPNFSLPQHMDRLYNPQTSVYGMSTTGFDSVQTSPPPFNQSPPFSQYDSSASFTYPTVISGISQSSYFPQSPGLYPQSPILTTHHHQHFSQMTIPPPPTPLLNSFPAMHSPPLPSQHSQQNTFYYPTATTTTGAESMTPYYTTSQLVSPNASYQYHYSSN